VSAPTPAGRPSRVLLAEDDDDVGRFLEVTLGVEGFEVERAVDGVRAVARAIEYQPDLILLDIGMPGLDGMSVCHELRRDPRTSALPIIMLTARVQQAEKVRGLDAGADDYVTKPFDPAELVARIQAALRRTRQLRDVSPLTGLPGNIAIFRHLERLLQAGEPFALLHADLDNFKAFNDRYGFAAGDEVIKATAAVLTTTLEMTGRSPSFAGHVGGDDFVLVTAADAAEGLAVAAVRRFDDLIPAYYDDLDRSRGGIEVVSRAGEVRRYPLMTISLGIVVSTSGPFVSPAELASVAAEMKNVAKAAETSSFCVNRRGAGESAAPSASSPLPA
jgi:diguanylate cyclase (GGDEF)-like protein